jgi:crossover junction endodeoxyribonuclease RuvC
MPPKIRTLPASSLLTTARVGSTQRRVERMQNMPPARRILGVDPGLHNTGYGVIQLPESTSKRTIGGQTAVLVEGGVLHAKAKDELPLRLETLHEALREVLREHKPDVMVIEELFSTYAHPRSALLMAHARGVLMLAAQMEGVPVHSFLPNEVKQVVSGNGHATKSAMQAAVRSRLKLNVALEPPDVADALALALCFAARQQLSGRGISTA